MYYVVWYIDFCIWAWSIVNLTLFANRPFIHPSLNSFINRRTFTPVAQLIDVRFETKSLLLHCRHRHRPLSPSSSSSSNRCNDIDTALIESVARREEPYRIVVLGPEKVGKTALINRFLDKAFPIKHKATTEQSNHFTYALAGVKINLEILDTSGKNEVSMNILRQLFHFTSSRSDQARDREREEGRWSENARDWD